MNDFIKKEDIGPSSGVLQVNLRLLKSLPLFLKTLPFSILVVSCLASPWAGLLVLPLFVSFFYMQFQRSQMLNHSRSLAAITTSHVISRKTDIIEGREIFLLYGKSQQLLDRMSKAFRS